MGETRHALTALYSSILFFSAFLLFSFELYFTKMVIPVFGGVPAVWTTSMVFFQLALLAGYIYAHLLSRALSRPFQAAVHLLLSAAAVFFLPVALGRDFELFGSGYPGAELFKLLLLKVGLPFFVLSASAPLLQKWYAGTKCRGAHNPYPLYAASNAGSFAAILSYPFLLEPHLSLMDQSRGWAGLFIVNGCLVGYAALLFIKEQALQSSVQPSAVVSWRQRLLWIACSFIPSSLVLGLTAYISTDIASIPLIWVAPLSLYLLSFILVFSSGAQGFAGRVAGYFPYGALIVFALLLSGTTKPLLGILMFHLAAFFGTSVYFHKKLSGSAPAPEKLTEFYICLAAGGAAGGLMNAVLAPMLLKAPVEYPFMIVVSIGVWALLSRTKRGVLGARNTALIAAAFLALYFSSALLLKPSGKHVLFRDRSFFGSYRVETRRTAGGVKQHVLHSGTTVHGVENIPSSHPPEPLSYYHPSGPAGDVFKGPGFLSDSSRVAVIGLGTGALISYAQPGQAWDFYEIDPLVARIAEDEKYFSFLKSAPAAYRIILGDGRVTLSKAADAGYEVIVVDAFTSDSIPFHLLTQEAVRLYWQKLKPDGILVFHVSNRYLELPPALDASAEATGADAVGVFEIRTPQDREKSIFDSKWVLMSKDSERLRQIGAKGWQAIQKKEAFRVWTDDFSDLLSVLG